MSCASAPRSTAGLESLFSTSAFFARMLAEGLAIILTLSRPVPAKAGMGEGTWLRLCRFRLNCYRTLCSMSASSTQSCGEGETLSQRERELGRYVHGIE